MTAPTERSPTFVELDDAHVAIVRGSDARSWLHDLVTTDVATLEPGRARPSLLLTPTGRVRAAFHVAALGDGSFALVQRGPAPAAVEDLLARYVLSSDVAVARSDLRVISSGGSADVDAHVSGPSVLGQGTDLLVAPVSVDGVVRALEATGGRRSTPGDVERARIERGEPRFPIDLDTDSLPAEAGWDAPPTTDRAKGCFLGQEAIAKVANLGHPTRAILPVRAPVELVAGEPVLSGAHPVGIVTSAAGGVGLARVAWAARETDLRTSSGVGLEIRDLRPVA